MAFLPISPLSPDLALVKPVGSAEPGLGPIPNVGDGIPGIGGIGSVELPGVGILTPGPGGFSQPQAPVLTQPAPSIAPAASLPTSTQPPEVTPFPQPGPAPSAAPSAAPASVQQPATVNQPSETGTQNQTGAQTQQGGQLQQPQQGSPYSTEPITTDQIPSLVQTPFTPTQSAVPVKDTPLAQTFGKFLQDAAGNYTDVQNQADNLIQRLATGQKVDIQDVSLALQKASITNQLAIQVRNRLVEAYQEIMRMQM